MDSPPSPKRVPDAFIPYQRPELLELCLRDGRMDESAAKSFRTFVDLFTAYTHFEFHSRLEDIKSNYWCFDPDKLTVDCRTLDADERSTAAGIVVDRFETLAELANFRPVTREEIEASFEDSTLFELKTEVNLEDFHKVSCFVRGESTKTERVQGTFREKDVECEVYERVLLLLHFQEEEYFQTAKQKQKGIRPNLSFTPGGIYVYFYKDVPKADLELLFPNVKMSMTPKDKIMLSVPAVGAGVAAIVKVLGKITLILAAVAITMSWDWLIDMLRLDEQPSVNQLAALTALFTVLVTLGSLAFKQWDKYKNKRTHFLKLVSENLFFRNLASNQSVFHRILDSAEEEECKEAMLVYYHLTANPDQVFTAKELDAHIERWMKESFGQVIDFDIDGPISNLQRIRGKTLSGEEQSLLRVTDEGHLIPLPLDEANHLLDYLWDHAYEIHQA